MSELEQVTKDLKTSSNAVESVLKVFFTTQLLEKLNNKKKNNKDQFLMDMKGGSSSFTTYEKFEQLPEKDRQEVFRVLLKENPKMLKELSEVAKAKKIAEELKNSSNKQKTLQQLVESGKLSKELIPYIKSFNV